MTALLALVAFQQVMPFKASFDYSGMPIFVGADNGSLSILSHSVTLDIDHKTAHVKTVTQLKNLTNQPLTLTVVLPRRRMSDPKAGPPSFGVTATMSGADLRVTQVGPPTSSRPDAQDRVRYANDSQTTITLSPMATSGLFVSYEVPLGKNGADQKMRNAGYALGGKLPIGQLQISYRIAKGVAFDLPTAAPKLGWQISTTGAFARVNNYQPHNETTWLFFYPSGFNDIG